MGVGILAFSVIIYQILAEEYYIEMTKRIDS
jgi:hypothetical protein